MIPVAVRPSGLDWRSEMRTLSHEEAKAFYDRFGARQDSQAFYEDRAVQDLIQHSTFAHAASVLEFGCGTGRLAFRLLSQELPPRAQYLGLDVSETMVSLASSRLAPYRDRAQVRLCNGDVDFPVPDGSVDRVVSTYVTDLLSDTDIRRLLENAKRVLTPDGRLCLVGITHGVRPVGRIVSRTWSAIHALRPSLVGGCRPMSLVPHIAGPDWAIVHSAIVRVWGISSEVLVAGLLEGVCS
jgi:ubiquinone/menaquinone biosynthesis C-methylase UbiE